MPIPIKSRYTIAEAAEFIASATGETVTQSQILDWGSQGFYRLYLPLEWATVRQVGKTDIARIGDSIVEVRLSSGQAATLGKGQRVGVSACWRDGIECNFMRQMSADYSGWTPDTVYFSSAGPVLLGAELIAFTASIAEPQKTAPATDTALELTAKPETVVAVSVSGGMNWTLTKPQRFQGYGKPLYDLLKAAHIAGQPSPKARDVLDKWKEKLPPDVASVTDNGLKYYDANGNTKPADLEAIRKAIDRMIR